MGTIKTKTNTDKSTMNITRWHLQCLKSTL